MENEEPGESLARKMFHKQNANLWNGESFRRTIMKQDEIFRYQVHELHRLYQMQKSLMTEVTELNQMDQNFDSYFDRLQRVEQHKGISCSNYRTSALNSGTSRYKQHEIHSDGESSDINLSLTLGIGIGSRPKREASINDYKPHATDVPWLYQALN